jgi:hypothetical protein
MFSIVSNNDMLRKIRTIDIFKLDLGKSVLNKKNSTLEIHDEFVKRYFIQKNRLIHKAGAIGSLIFYTDISIKEDVLVIFYNNKEYNVEYIDDGSSFKTYLSGLLKKIEEHEIQYEKELEKLKIQEPTLWTADDEKNSGKSYFIDQRLNREEYLKEFRKKKQEQF